VAGEDAGSKPESGGELGACRSMTKPKPPPGLLAALASGHDRGTHVRDQFGGKRAWFSKTVFFRPGNGSRVTGE